MFSRLLAFIGTKIGFSLLVALVIVVGASILKVSNQNPKNDIANNIGLIADTSVKNGIKNGDIVPSDWESTLKKISGVSATSDTVQSVGSVSTYSDTNTKELSATDRFAQTFFTKYVELKKSGSTIDENTGTNLVNDLLTQDYGSPKEEKIYIDSDIVIINSSSADVLRKYGNGLGLILNTPIPKGYENELTIITRVNDTGNMEDLKKLALNIARYETLRDKIAALPVPVVLKSAHLSLVNSISAMLEGVRGMTLIETDPVGATKMIARYEDGLKSLSFPLQMVKEYFISQNITFSPGEAGYILVK